MLFAVVLEQSERVTSTVNLKQNQYDEVWQSADI